MSGEYSENSTTVIKKYGKKTGLTQKQVHEKKIRYGTNTLETSKKTSAIAVFIEQFTSPLIYILIAAGSIAAILQDYTEAISIAAIILLNAILGFIQEYRAAQAIDSLKALSAPKARVLRNNTVYEIPAEEIVVGDILLLEAGDIVGADARIIEANELRADESILTGESVATHKHTNTLPENTRVADQKNMVFTSTHITYGVGKAIVTAIGTQTEFGKIAHHLQEAQDTQTPLQQQFEKLAKQISIGAGILLVFVLGLGMIQQTLPFLELFKLVLILAVATVPSALPLIVTISLSLGAKRLAKKNMLIKRLPAAEALGSTTVICTDKTGTLTQNKMTVVSVATTQAQYAVSGEGYKPEGEIEHNAEEQTIQLHCTIGAIANEATHTKENTIIGDPTEGALIVLAKKASVKLDGYSIHKKYPFDSIRKKMSVYLTHNKKEYVYAKGAPEEILKGCTHYYDCGVEKKLTKTIKENILKTNDTYAKQAIRVLATAYKQVQAQPKNTQEAEEKLIFVGLSGMIDPARKEIPQAIKECKQAGIRVIMITGDHPTTAEAIANNIGLTQGKILRGDELDTLTDTQLKKHVKNIRVIARAMPEHKVRIVRLLQEHNEIVAMTGDGVNDAPALKQANIGIAMGITGTEVAKNTADSILTDDNFASIVQAIKEGRAIYGKIMKSAKYLLSSNTGEIASILIAVLLGMPWPLVALQILLINVLTDTFPALGLGSDTPEDNIMKQAPRNPQTNPLNKATVIGILIFGVWIGINTVTGYYSYRENTDVARTVAFSTLVFMQLFAVQSYRTATFNLQRLNPFNNYTILGSILAAASVVLAVIYTPALQNIFSTTAIGLAQWSFILTAALIGILVIELSKLIGHVTS